MFSTHPTDQDLRHWSIDLEKKRLLVNTSLTRPCCRTGKQIEREFAA